MGMMKEHICGPIKCCETLCADILLKLRAMELSIHKEPMPVNVDACLRGKAYSLGNNVAAAFMGAPVMHTDRKVLKDMLRVLLEEECGGEEE